MWMLFQRNFTMFAEYFCNYSDYSYKKVLEINFKVKFFVFEMDNEAFCWLRLNYTWIKWGYSLKLYAALNIPLDFHYCRIIDYSFFTNIMSAKHFSSEWNLFCRLIESSFQLLDLLRKNSFFPYKRKFKITNSIQGDCNSYFFIAFFNKMMILTEWKFNNRIKKAS